MKGKKEFEKAKDFKGSIVRLAKELKNYKILIFISLTLAALGSIISIFTPNILSDMTNKISEGIIINKDNLNQITEEIKANVSEEKLATLTSKILKLDLSKENISKILSRFKTFIFFTFYFSKLNFENFRIWVSTIPQSFYF